MRRTALLLHHVISIHPETSWNNELPNNLLTLFPVPEMFDEVDGRLGYAENSVRQFEAAVVRVRYFGRSSNVRRENIQ